MDEENDSVSDLLDGCVPSGLYVTITTEGVASVTTSSDAAMVEVSILPPHENKASLFFTWACASRPSVTNLRTIQSRARTCSPFDAGGERGRIGPSLVRTISIATSTSLNNSYPQVELFLLQVCLAL
jgi:hypothetical protein